MRKGIPLGLNTQGRKQNAEGKSGDGIRISIFILCEQGIWLVVRCITVYAQTQKGIWPIRQAQDMLRRRGEKSKSRNKLGNKFLDFCGLLF